MIDSNGYRPNVGIVICNDDGKLFWAKRMGADAWQFPQGGIKFYEDPETAMYRELKEEVGLAPKDVELLGRTRYWLRYDLPEHYIRKKSKPLCIGQKQIWFLLRLVSSESAIVLNSYEEPEFDDWCWTDYWEPLNGVVYFKRWTYQRALQELGGLLVENTNPVSARGYLSKSGEAQISSLIR
ncbi:MAG TPA: RNA pyrophosphohydrolase [Methylococcales bacterium]|nr:RNA pyrophosphohydrolase [Methylococcales bacterium]